MAQGGRFVRLLHLIPLILGIWILLGFVVAAAVVKLVRFTPRMRGAYEQSSPIAGEQASHRPAA